MKNTFPFLRVSFLAVCLISLFALPLVAQDTLRFHTGNVQNVCVVYPFEQTGWFQSHSGFTQGLEGLALTNNAGTLTSVPIKVPLTNVEPFLSFSCVLSLVGAGENEVELSVRSSIDGVQYSEWQTLTFESNNETDYTGELIFLDQHTQYVQYKIDITADSPDIVLKRIKLSFINPGKTENIKKKLSVTPETSAGMPPVVSRTDWGCDDGQTSPLWTPKYATVTHLVIHHTAGSNNTAQDYAATVRSIWSYHTHTNGWGDIGYNYLIDNEGLIYEGRAGGNNAIGAHCSFNTGTMGVSVMGTYVTLLPSNAALWSLTNLLAWKCTDSNINPLSTAYHASSGKTIFTINGHRDVKPTECPGEYFYAQLPTIRKSVKAKMQADSPTGLMPANKTNELETPISFSWNPMPNATSYHLQISRSVNGWTAEKGWANVSDPATFNLPVNVTTSATSVVWDEQLLTAFAIADLNTRYFWSVRTITSSNDTSNFSLPQFFNTKGNCMLPVPPVLISGNSSTCGTAQAQLYSVEEVDNQTYTWTVENGWAEPNGNHCLVTWLGDGKITVTPSNQCADGSAKSMWVATAINLTIPESSKVLEKNSGNFAFDVTTCLTDFAVQSDANWLTVNKNGNSVSAYYTSNNDLYQRTATITISGSGSTFKQMLVTQKGLSTTVENTLSETLLCYPNPFAHSFFLSTPILTNAPFLVEITNESGQLVYSKMYDKQAIGLVEIERADIPKGIYLLKLTSNRRVVATHKLIKF